MSRGYSGGSKQFQRQANIALVMDLVRRAQPLSRIDIAGRLGLDRSTITHITSRLFDEGCLRVHSEGDATSKGGRRPTLLALNPAYGCILGIDISPDTCRIYVADFVGDPLWSGSFPLGGDASAPEQKIERAVRHALDAAAGTGHLPLGIGIAVPGIVAPDSGTVIESRELGITGYDLGREIARWTEIPVLLDNDARCCAYGEMGIVGAESSSSAAGPSFLFVMGRFQPADPSTATEDSLLKPSGIGIGVGVVVDGRIHAGAHNTAGEFRSVAWRADAPGQLGMVRERLAHMKKEEAVLRQGFEEVLLNLAPLVSVLDPEEIIFGGEFRRQYPLVLDLLDNELASSYIGIRSGGWKLRLSSNGEWETAAGAARMFIEHLFAIPAPEGRSFPNAVGWETLFDRFRSSDEVRTA